MYLVNCNAISIRRRKPQSNQHLRKPTTIFCCSIFSRTLLERTTPPRGSCRLLPQTRQGRPRSGSFRPPSCPSRVRCSMVGTGSPRYRSTVITTTLSRRQIHMQIVGSTTGVFGWFTFDFSSFFRYLTTLAATFSAISPTQYLVWISVIQEQPYNQNVS